MRRWMALLVLALAGSVYAAEARYVSVRVDGDAQLFLRLAGGREIQAPKLADQVGFESPSITADGRTLGWIALYAEEGSEPTAGRLVLYRNGRVLRSFQTDQVFWSWHFMDGDRDVAYCTGPTHGGAASCQLHRVMTGQLMGVWNPRGSRKVPAWAAGLSG